MEDRVGSGEAEVAAQHTGPREAAPPAVAWLVWSFLGATVAILLTGTGILLGVEQGRLVTGLPAGVSLWLRPRPDPVRDGTVTMPERWDGTTAPEEVP
jgi:hypothetical protein